MRHVLAAIVFLIFYVVGLQLVLGGEISNASFGWAILFAIAFGIPSLMFLAVSYVVFVMIRWWAPLLLLVAGTGIYVFGPGSQWKNWKIGLIVVGATIMHHLVLLAVGRARSIQP